MGKILIEKEWGAIPTSIEMEVVDILVLHKIPKKHVLFLRPNRTKGARTPDLQMDGVYWEIKTIEKLGKYTLEHALRSGLKQANNLIIDLRKLELEIEKKATKEIEREFLRRKGWKGLIIVVRGLDDCLTFNK